MDRKEKGSIADIREDESMNMITGVRNSNKRVIQLKDINGTVVGTMSVSTKSSAKTAKRLLYNFKQISSQIMMAKTSNGASRVATKARGKVAELLRKQRTGEYDEKELELAIIHARKMVRIAKKRMKHLEEEESAKQKGSCTVEREEYADSDIREEEERSSEYSEEELRKLMQECQELMEDAMDEIEKETGLDELAAELVGGVEEEMSPEDLERLKKKHRADEMREIMDADMKYLRALFSKLEREKQEASGGDSHADSGGVSLELAGMEMPVEVAEAPVAAEGGSIDLSV